MNENGPIIVIEDDYDDQELLKEIFSELKVSNVLKFFNSCLGAFEYLLDAVEKPFLVLSDINLPAMTGLELCRKIRNDESVNLKSIPFVFLTTTSDQRVIAEAFTMNAQGFFVKPSSIGELKNLIHVIVNYWKVCRRPFG